MAVLECSLIIQITTESNTKFNKALDSEDQKVIENAFDAAAKAFKDVFEKAYPKYYFEAICSPTCNHTPNGKSIHRV